MEWYDYGFREYDHQIGRFFRVDPLAEDFYYLTSYQYASNNPVTNIDLDGLEGIPFQEVFNYLVGQTVQNPNSTEAKILDAAAGVGTSVFKSGKGVVNLETNPVETFGSAGKVFTVEGAAETAAVMGVGVAEKVNTIQNGTGFDKAMVISEVTTDVATVIVGTKGAGTAGKAVRNMAKAAEAAEIGNEIGILRDAIKGKGYFGLGEASANASNKLGQAWVGDGAKVASDGKTMVSGNGLRQYRPPSSKSSSHATTGVQSNFEWRNKPQGQWQGNGHLNIKEPNVWDLIKRFTSKGN